MRFDWGSLVLFVVCALLMGRRPAPAREEAPRPLGDVVHTLADGGPEDSAP